MKINKTEKSLVYKAVKGVFSKPSGKYTHQLGLKSRVLKLKFLA